MNTSIINRIRQLQAMTVNQLRDEWFKLYQQPTNSRNRDFLFRRLAWKLQEVQLGGLSDRARRRIDELAPDGFERARTPGLPPLADAPADRPMPRVRRDPRLPTPGTVISKRYKGRELRVTVRDDAYEFDGAMYPSLTALARTITGSKNINGKLFFGLTVRNR